MNYKKFRSVLVSYLEDDTNSLAPICIEGETGIGKTQIVEKLSIDSGYKVYLLQIGTKMLEHFSGMPYNVTVNGVLKCKWTVPEIIDNINSNEKTLLFIDDFHLAREEERKIMFELLTNNSIHDYKVTCKSFKIVICMNPTSNDYGNTSGNIPKPIITRMCRLVLTPDVNSWIKASLDNKINSVITSFISMRNEFLVYVNDNDEELQYACPRTWWNLSKFIDMYGYDSEFVNGCVGNYVGNEFIMYYNIYMEYEKNLPKKYKDIDKFSKKAAFVSYIISKKDIDLTEKYLKQICDDDESKGLAAIMLYSISSVMFDSAEDCSRLYSIVGKDIVQEIMGFYSV